MKGKHRRQLFFIVLLLTALVVGFCVNRSLREKGLEISEIAGIDLSEPAKALDGLYRQLEEFLFGSSGQGSAGGALPVSAQPMDGELQVHILDMGQADSILIRTPETAVLIDAGENDQGDMVLRYLADRGIERLDLLIATHPHSDHIGGMDTVIDTLEIGQIILSDPPADIVPTTQTYTDFLMAIERKNLPVVKAAPGLSFDLGNGISLTVLGPQREYADLNNLSVVCRVDYDEISFLFTGDIEAAAELDLLQSGLPLAATVLDAPHHGSRTSSTPEFLLAVSPRIATISCGLDNSYGHPHRETMEALGALDAEIARTDRGGTIVIMTDGQQISLTTER